MKFSLFKVNTCEVTETDGGSIYEADLDQALDVAGIGRYNIKYCFVLAFFLVTAVVEPLGYGYVLPAAKCDLEMTDAQRGFIASIPFIGIAISSFPWGYLIDTCGRKRSIIYSALLAGTFSILAAFMPNLRSFALCKLLTSLCLTCSAAAPYTYVGEIVPPKHKDVAASFINAIQIMGSCIVPLLAWAILFLDFRIDFVIYYFRPWRVLSMIYGSFFIIGAVLLSGAPESPKFLVSQSKYEETLNVLKIIYSKNKRKSPDEYPIKSLKRKHAQIESSGFWISLKAQSIPLMQLPYIKWMALNSILLFGIYAILNGLYVWVPDFVNRILVSNGVNGSSACTVIVQEQPGLHSATCDDSAKANTFLINSIASFICGLMAVAISATLKVISKKTLLFLNLVIIGVCCSAVNFVNDDVLVVILLQASMLVCAAVGPIGAYTAEIFPTHLRGMAMCLSMMIGRSGSIFGTNMIGSLLNTACEATFYLFGGLLLLCAILSFLFPKNKTQDNVKSNSAIEVTKL